MEDLLTLVEKGQFAESPHLSLSGYPDGDRAARVLAATEQLPALTELDLGGTPLGVSGARALGRSPLLWQLQALRLSCADLGDAGVVAVFLPRRRALSWILGGMGGAAPGAGASGDEQSGPTSPYRDGEQAQRIEDAIPRTGPRRRAPRLCRLDLSGNRIGEKGARVLGISPLLVRLVNLDLSANALRAGGTRLLLAPSSVLSALRCLDLRKNELGNAGVASLAASPLCPQLTWLNLGFNHITDEGARALAHCPMLHNLMHLDLSHNRIGYLGVRSLLDSSCLRSLDTLILSGNAIDERELAQLMSGTSLRIS